MNPYEAPRATVDQPDRGRSLLAVVTAGFLLGTGLAFTVQTLSGVVLTWLLVSSGVRTEDLYSAMAESPGINLWAHLLNVAAVMCAGAATAWLKPEAPIATASWLGGVMVAFVVLQFAVPYDYPAPLWSKVLTLITPIPSAIGGALLLKQHAGRRGS
jgi:hypothetical protein